MLAMEIHDSVHQGLLVGNVFIVEEVLPALRLVKVPDLS